MTTQTQEQEKWPLPPQYETEYVTVPKNGRYLGKITSAFYVKEQYQGKGELQPYIKFYFHIKPPRALKTNEKCVGERKFFYSANVSKNLCSTLAAIQKDGCLPDEILSEDRKTVRGELLERFIKEQIGKVVSLTIEISKGKYHKITDIQYSSEPDWAEKEKTEETETLEPNLVEAPSAVCGYNIAPLVSDKIKYEKAKKYLADAGAKEIFKNQWESPVEIKALQNYKTIVDNIPF